MPQNRDKLDFIAMANVSNAVNYHSVENIRIIEWIDSDKSQAFGRFLSESERSSIFFSAMKGNMSFNRTNKK